MAFLWTGDKTNIPQGYSNLNLCRIYGCRPSELEREDWGVIQEHIRYLNVEAEVREREKQKGYVATKPGVPEKAKE